MRSAIKPIHRVSDNDTSLSMMVRPGGYGDFKFVWHQANLCAIEAAISDEMVLMLISCILVLFEGASLTEDIVIVWY
ncbi:hypothetical protein WAI453_005942 [Rhynchosporium graminicola]